MEMDFCWFDGVGIDNRRIRINAFENDAHYVCYKLNTHPMSWFLSNEISLKK